LEHSPESPEDVGSFRSPRKPADEDGRLEGYPLQ